MEYRLIVMRHAKSDWYAGAGSDHARPLNRRGRRDAPRIAQRLVELGWTPSHVISSDSERTTETFSLMQPILGDVPVDFQSNLYHGGLRDLEESVSKAPEERSTLLALGHNPGWQESVWRLSGQSVEMTTANAALMCIEAECWGEAIFQHGDWKLVDVLRPKEL